MSLLSHCLRQCYVTAYPFFCVKYVDSKYKLYLFQPDGFKLTPMDPRWIGNWWIGSLVGAFVIFPMSLVIIGFPRQLPHVRAQREKAIMNNEIPARDQDIRGKVKDIIPATKRLLSNPVYVFQSLGVWAQ